MQTHQQTAHDIARECITTPTRMKLGGRHLMQFDKARAHALASERGEPAPVHQWIDMVTAVEAP